MLNCKSRKLTCLHTNQRSQDISQQRETNRKHNIQSCIVYIYLLLFLSNTCQAQIFIMPMSLEMTVTALSSSLTGS